MSATAVIGIREQGALELICTLLQQGVTVRLRVSGSSMLPFIREGDLLEVAPLREKNIRKGDILFFCDRYGNPLVHRLHRRRYYSKVLYLQTKGDGCAGYDSPVPVHRVFGRVQRIITDQTRCNLESPGSYLSARLLVARTTLCFFLHRIKRTYERWLG